MKLASYKSGRDGKLLVVSRDLRHCVHAGHIAPTMQDALDDWARIAPQLEALSDKLNAGKATDMLPFVEPDCAAPLPRAYQWADASAYVNHVELVRKSRGVEMPESFWHDPLMYQGGSDTFLGPRDDILIADTAWCVDYEAELSVITGDVPMGVTPQDAAAHIRLVMLVNDVSLRGLAVGELVKGFGFFQAKPSSAFSPVAITPDELGEAWQDHKVHLPLLSFINGKPFGKPNAAQDLTFNFPKLISHAARTRHLGAGTIIGSGTVSNKTGGEYGKPIEEGGVGYSCIVERRMIEKLNGGESVTPFLQYGDTVRIEMKDAQGKSLFGTIEQKLVRYENP